MSGNFTPARNFTPGMGEAVAARTITRKITKDVTPYTKDLEIPRRDDISLDHEVEEYCKSLGLIKSGYTVQEGDGEKVHVKVDVVGEVRSEVWADVAKRVALGNALLEPDKERLGEEYDALHHHLRQGSVLMSGRHLQHGDENQPNRPGEVMTNCSTSAASFLKFLLLLSGSGVGRSYDDAMMVVNWCDMPMIVTTIEKSHADCATGEINIKTLREAKHMYKHRNTIQVDVPDSREGWAKCIELIESLSFSKQHRDSVLILDFTGVRPRGSPIKGMQNRPASGPGPLIEAINYIAEIRQTDMPPWRATMYVDHYIAQCVLVGGARRAARMATKTWRDATIFDFIEVKRGGFLWSANNSVLVDQEFWNLVKQPLDTSATHEQQIVQLHAKRVFEKVCEASYFDRTGEPGFINQDRLTTNNEGVESLLEGDFAQSSRYEVEIETRQLMKALAKAWRDNGSFMIVNPCAEIPIIALGAYCTIADNVPFHADRGLGDDDWDAQAEDSFKVAARALIRTNLMEFMYGKEVKRTNRIGVGLTGIHEYAWARFGLGWKDLIDEQRSLPFWLMLSRFKRALQQEAERYSRQLGVNVPHTDSTCKPSGTVSKLFGLTEGAHLPSMREFVRWVQFRNDDPLVSEYEKQGYPIRRLTTYNGTTIVGFPTRPTICTLGMGDNLVTAAEATPEEQYQYLRLLEKYYIRGVEEDGVTPLRETGGQVSYTLKFNPDVVGFEEFRQTLMDGQSTIRCCSVMPQTNNLAYEYTPEEAVDRKTYERICKEIEQASNGSETIKEDVGVEHVDCASGACPISFNGE
jgi:hypothetical protein